MELIMDGEMNLLKKNIRYRTVDLEGESYILDMETSIWPIFLPFLFWLIPQKMYKVDTEIARELREPTAGSTSSPSTYGWLGAGGALILTPIVKPLLDHTVESTMLINIVLLIGLVTFFILLRLHLHKMTRDKLYQTVDIDKLETIKVKIRPKYISQYTNPIFFWLFSGAFALLVGFYAFLITSDLIPLVSFVVFFPMHLLVGSFVVHPHIGKTKLQRVFIVG